MTHVSIGYLRLLAEKAPTPIDRDHFNAVADEIERLRELITAWADADDAVSHDDYVNTLRIREQARDALRKAVGR